MGRFLLRAVVLVACVWTVMAHMDQVRVARHAAVRLWETLAARAEMQTVANTVRTHYAETGVLPVYNLGQVLSERSTLTRGSTAASGRDRWGTLYQLLPTEGGFAVSSAGPDRVWDTRDDLRCGRQFPPLGSPAGGATP